MGRRAKTTYPRMELELADQHLMPARRAEVVRLAAIGLSTKEIAKDLGISPGTVSSHLEEAQEQLHAHNRVDLVSQGWMHGLFKARALAVLLMAFALMPAMRSRPKPVNGTRPPVVRTTIGRTAMRSIYR